METCRQSRGLFSTGLTRAHLFSVVLVFLGWLAFRWDVSVAVQVHAWSQTNPAWFDTLKHFCNFVEVFAHGQGVFLILAGVYFLDVANRRCVLRLAACAALSGWLAVAFKTLVVRTRPLVFVPKYLESGAEATFGEWFSLASTDVSLYEFQSFPSGHAATAVGLAVGLAWRYPHARRYFVSLAVFAALQRILSQAHFVSDVLFGAAIGSALGLICVGPGYLGRFLTRFEQRQQEDVAAVSHSTPARGGRSRVVPAEG